MANVDMNFPLFKGKTFSDLLGDIYENQQNKKKNISTKFYLRFLGKFFKQFFLGEAGAGGRLQIWTWPPAPINKGRHHNTGKM